MRVCKVLLVSIFLVYIIQPGEGRKSRKSRIEGKYVCKSKKTCLPNSKCSGKYKTVFWEQICDGEKQCPCGDDEQHCAPDCPGQYQCTNSTCIQGNTVCNGANDCTGGEDEENCPPPTPPTTTCPPLTTCPTLPPSSCPPTTPTPTCPTTSPQAPCPGPPCSCYTKVCYSNIQNRGSDECPDLNYILAPTITGVTQFNMDTLCRDACDALEDCIVYQYSVFGNNCVLSSKTVDEIIAVVTMAGASESCFSVTETNCNDAVPDPAIQHVFFTRVL